MTDERSWVVACNIGSLNFMNCRSRAEAFARRLHTKLRSLGRSTDDSDDISENVSGRTANGLHGEEGAADEHTYTETSHLISAPVSQQQQQEPPPPLSFRDEEELFYDFDLESPGTPVSEDEPLFLVNSYDNLCFDVSRPLKAMGPACTRQPRSTIHDATECPYRQAGDPKMVAFRDASQQNEHWNNEQEMGNINGSSANEVSANGGHGPKTVIDSPVEESQESAYCSGGEQDGRVLDQGQSAEPFPDSADAGNRLLTLSTALTLAEEESDEDDDELFSECQESVDGEADGEWRQWKAAPAEEESRKKETEQETGGMLFQSVTDAVQAMTLDILQNEVNDVILRDKDESDEKGEEKLNDIHENIFLVKKTEVISNIIDETIEKNEPQQRASVENIKIEVVDEKAEENESVAENIVESREGKTNGVKDDVRPNENNDIVMEEDDAKIDDGVNVNETNKLDKRQENAEEEKEQEEDEMQEEEEEEEEEEVEEEDEEEDDEEEEEEFIHSPTWGTLKQIDRFQVRKLVQESHEVSSLYEFDDNKDSDGREQEETQNEEENDVCKEFSEDSSDGPLTVMASEESNTKPLTISVTINIPDEEEFVHPRPPTPPVKKEEENIHPPRIYRSSSLRTGKTPPGTPSCKKIVRFADVLGLDLEDVRHVFLDDLPTVPQSAYSDLDAEIITDNVDSSAENEYSSPAPRARRATHNLIAMFSQPGLAADFMSRVAAQKVCLENAIYNDSVIRGTVRVLNIDFHKSVFIRYTLNEWKTHVDLEANYVPSSSDGVTDRFSFCIYGGDSLDVGERLVFCLRYQVHDQQFWDNNNGQNYFFQCIMESLPLPPSPVEDWIHFL